MSEKPTMAAGNSAPAGILIVDDNTQLAASLVVLFQRYGFNATAVRNGRCALKHLSAHRVDILITDIFMPNGDGLELLRELYQRRILVRIIAMTGGEQANMPDMLHVATLMGAEHTIPKPFEPAQILRLVETMLRDSAWVPERSQAAHAGQRNFAAPANLSFPK